MNGESRPIRYYYYNHYYYYFFFFFIATWVCDIWLLCTFFLARE